MKALVIRASLAAIIIAGFLYEEWYFGRVGDTMMNHGYFKPLVDIRDPRSAYLFLVGEWRTTTGGSNTRVIKRETIMRGPFGSTVWLPGPAWLNLTLANIYAMCGITLSALLIRDCIRWKKRRAS